MIIFLNLFTCLRHYIKIMCQILIHLYESKQINKARPGYETLQNWTTKMPSGKIACAIRLFSAKFKLKTVWIRNQIHILSIRTLRMKILIACMHVLFGYSLNIFPYLNYQIIYFLEKHSWISILFKANKWIVF